MLSVKIVLPIILLVLCNMSAAAGLDKAIIRFSTQSAPWAKEQTLTIEDAKTASSLIDIDTTVKYQTLEGMGGCFNELGWKALKSLPAALSDSVIKELFDTTSGCKLNFCRMPIGASDFALNWYSLNENANDTLMTKISIERDKGSLIPFIKAAMKYNPNLKMWASPWSPPSWMKTNNSYSGANAQFKQQPTYFNAYVLYFEKAIRLYRAEGVNLRCLAFQNEPWSPSSYPGCMWSPAQIRDFIKLYLGPRFEADSVDCDIWSPTMNNGDINSFKTLVDDPGCAKYVKNMCFQYEGRNVVKAFHAAYPDIKLYQTETECGNGANDWAYAETPTFYYMKLYFDNGASGYIQWNMVLDNSGSSSWAWVQNAMVSIDTAQKKIRFNPQFYVVKHFGQYVAIGAKKIKSSGTFANHVAFLNPDGSIAIVANNTTTAQVSLGVRFGTKMVNTQLPAKSFASILISNSAASTVAPKVSGNGARSPEISVLRYAKGIIVSARGQALIVRLVGLDGGVREVVSSRNGYIAFNKKPIAPGAYIVAGTIDGRNFRIPVAMQ